MFTEKDLIWALWFMSEAQLTKRLASRKRAPQSEYDRYDAIEAWATKQHNNNPTEGEAGA